MKNKKFVSVVLIAVALLSFVLFSCDSDIFL